MPDRSAIIDALRGAGVECFTRQQWGSPQERAGKYAERRGTHPMPPGPADYHFLHLTVTADTDTVAEGAAGARQIETYGYSSPPMVSYQDLVTNEGRYFQGQDYGTKGTHTVNDKKVPGYSRDLNLYGYATALMQNVGDEVTDDQVHLVAMIFAARELAGWVRRGAQILPHRTFAYKSCPGDLAVARLPEINRLRDQYVRTGLPTTQEDIDMMDKETRAWLGQRFTTLRKQNARVLEACSATVDALDAVAEDVAKSDAQVKARIAKSRARILAEIRGLAEDEVHEAEASS